MLVMVFIPNISRAQRPQTHHLENFTLEDSKINTSGLRERVDYNCCTAKTRNEIQIRCKNNKKSQKVEIGSTLFDIFSAFDLKMTHGPVSARVNNKVEGMHYRVYNSKECGIP